MTALAKSFHGYLSAVLSAWKFLFHLKMKFSYISMLFMEIMKLDAPVHELFRGLLNSLWFTFPTKMSCFAIQCKQNIFS